MPRRNRGPYLKFLKQRGCYYIQWAEGGRTRQRSTRTADRGAAEEALAQFILDRKSGQRDGPVDPREFPVTKVLEIYGAEVAPTRKDPQRIGYCIDALLPYWTGKSVGEITRRTCDEYGNDRGMSPGTIRRELGALYAAVKYAKTENHITFAPTVHLPQKPDGKDRWLTRGEAARLLNAARTGHASTRTYLPLFVLLGLYGGARKGAILSLRWHQVDLDARRINFHDASTERTSKGRAHIPIPRTLYHALKRAKRMETDIGYVVQRDGRPIKNIKRAFMSACADAGLTDVTPHTLRHTCGTWLAHHGVPLDKIGAWLGHSDSRTTRLYAHHHPDYMDEALEVFDRRRA